MELHRAHVKQIIPCAPGPNSHSSPLLLGPTSSPIFPKVRLVSCALLTSSASEGLMLPWMGLLMFHSERRSWVRAASALSSDKKRSCSWDT